MTMPGALCLLFGMMWFAAAGAEPNTIREFPFEYRDSLIFVSVQVQSRDSVVPLNFLLDSGAGLNVINLPVLRRIGNLHGRRITVRGVGGSAVGYWPQHLKVSNEGLPLVESFLAVDLSEFSRSCDRSVDGLVGVDFFMQRVVQIDFEARKIRLLSSSDGPGDRIQVPLRLQGRALETALCINGGQPQWMRLDTGCATALHWVNKQLKSQDCTPALSIALTTLPVNLTHTTVQLGGTTLDLVPTKVHAEPIFDREAGLLGNGLLSRFASITIDQKAGLLFLTRRH